jgi:aryl-alcohol dehydrogenase-like predicted oxidoreductase
MPEKLRPLTEHIDRLVEIQKATPYSLPELALRFVLSNPDISTIIVGADRMKYLEEAVSASDGRGLNDEILARLEDMALDDPYLLNPGNWGIP